MALFDIDEFIAINDLFGEIIGDRIFFCFKNEKLF
jgi:GGDEF domain-containing protein